VLDNRSGDPECAHVVDGSHTDRPDPAVEHAKWAGRGGLRPVPVCPI
jgi:hypothetical protein